MEESFNNDVMKSKSGSTGIGLDRLVAENAIITIWTYIEGEPYRKYIDCRQSKVWMEHYEHSK
jgi:hypothetical protein